MKRPLFWVGLFYLAGILGLYAFGVSGALLLAAIGLAAGFSISILQKGPRYFERLAILFLSVGLGISWGSLQFSMENEGVLALAGETRTFTGVITWRTAYGGVDLYEIYGSAEDGSYSGPLTFFGPADVAGNPGEGISVPLRVRTVAEGPEYGNYNLTKGVFATGTLRGSVTLLPESGHPIRGGIAHYRSALKEAVHRLLPKEEAGFLTALLLGDRSGMTDAFREEMARSGMAHILAVSGLHLVVLIELLSRVLLVLGIQGKRGAALSILACWLVAIMTGMGAPVVRAAVMLTVRFSGDLLGREGDSLNSLGLAAILIGTVSPAAVTGLSMQMSFLSCLSINLFCGPIQRGLLLLCEKLPFYRGKGREPGKMCRALVEMEAVTLSSQVLLLPLTFLVFGYVSLASPITSLLVLPFLPFVLGGGLIGALLELVGLGFLGRILIFPVGILLRYTAVVAAFFGKLPLCWYLRESWQQLWIMWSGGVGIWMLRGKSTALVRQTALLLTLCLLLFGNLLSGIFAMGTVRAISLQGSGTFLLVRGDRAVVVGLEKDPGPLREELRRQGVGKLDLLLLTDTGYTTSAAAADFLRDYPPAYLWAPENPIGNAYLETVYFGERLTCDRLGFTALGGVMGEYSEGEGLFLEIDGKTLLKSTESYDIMEGRPTVGSPTLLLDGDGTPLAYQGGLGSRMLGWNELRAEFVFSLGEGHE